MLKRFLSLAALLLLAALFFAAVGDICVLRFRRGDVYPLYSSLRSDPVGVKALYDALAAMDGLQVQRNYRPLHKLQPKEPCTLFYLGANLGGDTEDWDDLWRLALAGNRVVIAFQPTTFVDEPKAKAKKSPTPAKKDAEKQAPKEPDETAPAKKWILWADALRKMGAKVQKEKAWAGADLKAQASTPGTEPVISWHSLSWLQCSGTNQVPLYRCEEKPVIVEHPVGKGSFVFATDCYFLSNEALHEERAPRLLAAFAGENREILFDEFHLGSEEQSGISTLIREYRLEGVCLVFALLAALYVWKNATPMLPRAEESPASGTVLAGRTASEGFVNLLRRSIPPSRIVGVCVEEWNSAFAHTRGRTAEPIPNGSPDAPREFSQLARKLSNKRTQ